MPCYLSNINLLSDSLLEYKKGLQAQWKSTCTQRYYTYHGTNGSQW